MSRKIEKALDDIAQLIGAQNLLTDDQDKDPFLRELRGLWLGQARAIARPATTEQVANIVRRAAAAGMHIVPQSGNTGLSGGQIAFDKDKALIINMARMNKIRAVDKKNNSMIVEAGCVLADIHQAAARIGRQFPLRLASEGSCQIGGLVATNAGGHHVLRYGMMRDLTLGLEAVLADGNIWHGLSLLRKDNSGYDLKNLLIGSEGSLAIICAAAIKLAPENKNIATAMLSADNISAASDLFYLAQQHIGADLIAFELMPRIGIEFMLRHFDAARDPIPAAPAPWYVLADSTSHIKLEKWAEACAQYAKNGAIHGAIHGTIASSKKQADMLWFLRENLSDVQKKEGASIKHDISIPISAMPEFITQALQAVKNYMPNIRPVPFGHMGDGNIHFNLSRPENMSDDDFLAARPTLNKIIYSIVLEFSGSISAEHGIGVLKREELLLQKGETAINMMKKIKQALDPNNIFNPKKIFL